MRATILGTTQRPVGRPVKCRTTRLTVVKVAGSQQATDSAIASSIKQQFLIKDDIKALFEPLKLGRFELQHRIVMAPLTRNRAPGTVPAPAMGTYYSQRATPGGLLISEATCISQQGSGYLNAPGIYSLEQVRAWKPIVQEVKQKGAVFFCQLLHAGRASHQDLQPNGGRPVAPSEIRISDAFEIKTPKGGPYKYPTPRVLDALELPGIVKDHVDAARNAIEAGFDGIEIYGANGYLLDQFWKDSSNKRSDKYGGSDKNKARLLLEVMEDVAAAIGADRVGLRLSPYSYYLDARDTVERAIEKNVWLMKELDRRVPGLAYIHMVEPRVAAGTLNCEVEGDQTLNPFREATSRPFLVAGGYRRDTAIAAIKKGEADAIVLGRYFIANPDLVKRYAMDAPLNKYDRSTFNVVDPYNMKGYIDYPFLEE